MEFFNDYTAMLPMSKKEEILFTSVSGGRKPFGGISVYKDLANTRAVLTASKPSLVSCRGGVRSNGLGKVASSFGQTIPVSCRQLISSQQSM